MGKIDITPRFVEGNDTYIRADLYESIDGSERPLDLSLCDDIEVRALPWSGVIEHLSCEGVLNGLVLHLPASLPVGLYSLQVTLWRGGNQSRCFDLSSFRVVRSNKESNVHSGVYSSGEGQIRVELSFISQVRVNGKDAFELWKELPGNEGKTRQNFIDEYLDLSNLTASLRDAEGLRVQNERTRVVNEEARELKMVQFENAERERVEAEAEREEVFAADHSTAVSDHQTSVSDHASVVEAVSSANGAATNAENKASEAERVNATLDGTVLTVTNRNGVSQSVNVKGADGVPGQDGFSPTATVVKSGSVATITITDKNGTTTATISDGESGSGGGESASAFVAEYGVTPYADIKDAYDEGAIIICTVDDSGNTVVLQLAYFDDTNDTFIFTQPVSEGAYWVSISIGDTWDDGYFQFASTETATQLRDGLMTALDKQKLDAIASGAEVNVQANWNETNTSSDAFIQNKPTDLAHIGDTQGSATIANFDPQTDTVHIAAQVLSAAAQAQARENIGAGTSNFSGSYNDLTDKPTIPTVPSNIVVGSSQSYTIAVVSSMPGSPDPNTIYLVTGS